MPEPLITKYRPKEFETIVGHETIVKSLSAAVTDGVKSFLFTGPSGVGKTTLARIVAEKVRARVEEMCAATYSGVDDTRNIVEFCQFRPVDGKPVLYIIDECHNLSKKGWEPLLKVVEEPPSLIYFAFCTTDVTSVPATIKSRCFPVALRALKPNDISLLLEIVVDLEEWKVESDVLNAIIAASEGSARKALTILQAGHGVKDKQELSEIILQVESDDSPISEICRLLLSGNGVWDRYALILKKIESTDDILPHATRYICNEIPKSDTKRAKLANSILSEFLMPRDGYDQKVKFINAITNLVLGG